ncbi:PAS domain-containing protein [Brumicola pallidula]|uniref:PAS domain-containing protein n=1 Tax=Brumicola pallidula TaxID=56807 RepID=UPI00047D4FC6|nr:PAS domain-containing protein [Glaciecola pallidula]
MQTNADEQGNKNDEKDKRAAELVIANNKLAFQNEEKDKRADELILANEKKEKRANELILANTKLAFQNEEKDKRADELILANEKKEKRANELILANTKLAFQNEEKDKRADELILANEEKEKRANELVLANAELAFQNAEKDKRADELILANQEKDKRADELILANQEKDKRADELILANQEKDKRADELILANEEKDKRADELILANEEKEKRANELVLANEELAFQNAEKEKRADELVLANTELAFQNAEKEKRANELVLANTELAFQNEEKDKRADELILANQEKDKRADELILANQEKDKRADELILANQEKDKRADELILANEEKEKRANELVLANTELAFQNEEKDKRAFELVLANKEKEKRADELVLANKELAFQSEVEEKRADELILANEEKSKRADELIIANEEKDKRADELVLANKEKDKWADELVIANKELALQIKLDAYRSERVRVAKELTIFIDTANAPIFGVDAEGNVNQWNQKSAEITGFQSDEVLGKNLVEEFITADYRESVNEVLQKALKGNETSNFEFPLYTKDNNLVMVLLNATTRRNANGDVVGVVGVGQDITELDSYRSEMEAKVKKRTRELDIILTLSPDGFVLANADNIIVYINPALLNMTGLQAPMFIGKSANVFSDAMVNLYNSERMEDISIIGTEDSERLIYLSYPVLRILNCNIRTMYGLTGVKEGQVFYFRDVTHETEVDKMKSEFLSTAAHELRTPLASIYGFSELLMNRDYDKKMSHEIFETIHRQSLNLKHLLDELLDLSRIEARAGKDFYMVKQSLQDLLIQSCAEAEGAFNGRKVEVQSLGHWPILSFDIDKMRQVFNNLLNNGFKYSPGNKNVILKTSQREKNGNMQFGVSIIDKGIGMAPQQLSRIGERFYRADESGSTPGTGLGLSLVKEIVTIHAGDIEFVSSKGNGMAVTVWLPIVKINLLSKE